MINFLQTCHNRHHIACPCGRDMVSCEFETLFIFCCCDCIAVCNIMTPICPMCKLLKQHISEESLSTSDLKFHRYVVSFETLIHILLQSLQSCFNTIFTGPRFNGTQLCINMHLFGPLTLTQTTICPYTSYFCMIFDC